MTAQSRSCQETLFAVSVAQGAVRRAGRAPPQTRSARRCLAGGRSWLSLAARTCAKSSKGGEGCSSPQSRAVGIAATGIRPSRGGGAPSRERRCARREDVREGLCRGGGCGAGDLLQRASHEWTRGDVEEESAPGCGLGLARRPRLGDGARVGPQCDTSDARWGRRS